MHVLLFLFVLQPFTNGTDGQLHEWNIALTTHVAISLAKLNHVTGVSTDVTPKQITSLEHVASQAEAKLLQHQTQSEVASCFASERRGEWVGLSFISVR